jgi:heptaprenyl diphosphate synthase
MRVMTTKITRNKAWNKKGTLQRGDVALIAVFLAFILITGLLERLIPLDFIVPGARLGLSNIVILVSLYIFKRYISVILVVLKCLLLSFIAGGPSSLFYSLGGSLLALLVMAALIYFLGEKISPVGVSVAGAAAHSTGQVAVSCIILQNAALFLYLPLLGIISIISGFVVGIIAQGALPSIRKAVRSR